MMKSKYVEWLNQLAQQGKTMFDLTKRVFYAGNSGDCRGRTRLVIEEQKKDDRGFDCPCLEGTNLSCSYGPCPFRPWGAAVIPLNGKTDPAEPLVGEIVMRIYRQMVALAREFAALPCPYKSEENEHHPSITTCRICFAPQPNKRDWEKEIHHCDLSVCPLNNPPPELWGEEEEKQP